MQNIVTSISERIDCLRQVKTHLLIAIDGRCAAGKTSLAAQLQEKYDCNVIHMDHFFLRPQQRTQERLQMAGGNVDHERFLEEVLKPISAGKSFSYRPFDCKRQKLAEPISINPCAINIIEGSYSCHQKLWDYYDLRLFLTVDSQEQLRRIIIRDGVEKAELFRRQWIPLEERYFAEYKIAERCDACYIN
ncbi:MAG: hypothetical protein E7269_03810 [Lachnospiraceae bacterium]|nr:hypothetical protein [Lachnospiraceae bacterium]